MVVPMHPGSVIAGSDLVRTKSDISVICKKVFTDVICQLHLEWCIV